MTSPSSPAPYPENAAERDDAVRRRALPIAISALICGIAGLALLLAKTIDQAHPPAVLAVNLSFCSMMMGVGILFYARRTRGTAIATVLCALAIAVGFAGPLVYAKQTLDYRKSAEDRELGNVAAIANAARDYALHHAGDYPDDLGVLLEEKSITPETLHSPYAATPLADRTAMGPADRSRADFLKYLDSHSDYQYFGAGIKLTGDLLKSPPNWSADHPYGPDVQPAKAIPQAEADFDTVIIATAREPIMRINIAVAYADGRSEFVDLEHAEDALKSSNAARTRLNFPTMHPPESIDKALKENTTKESP